MNFSLLIPETTLLALSLLSFLLTLTNKESVSKALNALMVLAGFVLLASTVWGLGSQGVTFYSTYRIDLFSQGFKLILALSFLLTVLLSKDMFSISSKVRAEYYFFLSTALLGMMMLASAMDAITLFIGLELSAYSLYLLSALRHTQKSAEASVKYLIFGAATSGIFLWGFSLIVGLSGTTSLAEIAAKAPALSSEPAFLLGVVFASLSFLFKLSGFPVHFWAPDVYETAATPVTTFIATASKAAAVAVFIRVFMLFGISPEIIHILALIAFASMTLGNCVALVQKDVKRLLAYSSIAQAGYILVGLLAGSFEGYSSTMFYALAYVLMNTGAFLVVICVAKEENNDNPQLSHFDGLAERSPLLSLVLLLSLLSLAGIPPLVGFTAKWVLFSAAMDKGHWFLVLWGVLNSVVSLFYYLTLVKHAYLEKPKVKTPLVLSKRYQILALFLFCAIVLLGVFPNYCITFAQEAVKSALPLTS